MKNVWEMSKTLKDLSFFMIDLEFTYSNLVTITTSHNNSANSPSRNFTISLVVLKLGDNQLDPNVGGTWKNLWIRPLGVRSTWTNWVLQYLRNIRIGSGVREWFYYLDSKRTTSMYNRVKCFYSESPFNTKKSVQGCWNFE